MKGYLYILKSPRCKRCYVGSTVDVANRLREHNAGENTSTRGKGPWRIEFQSEFRSIDEARRAERHIKRMKSRKYIEKIIQEGRMRLPENS